MRVGLGSDVAGGYSADVMSAMRWAVGVSRMREGVRTEQTRAKGQQGEEVWDGGGRRGVRGAEEVEVDEEVKIDWREAMYMATRGGTEALGLETRLEEGERKRGRQRRRPRAVCSSQSHHKAQIPLRRIWAVGRLAAADSTRPFLQHAQLVYCGALDVEVSGSSAVES